jgi:nucleoid DNA-binding protein
MKWRVEDVVARTSILTGLPKKTCKQILDALFATIEEQISLGNEVEWMGFGRWSATRLRARKAKDFKGNWFTTKPRMRPKFQFAWRILDKFKRGIE